MRLVAVGLVVVLAGCGLFAPEPEPASVEGVWRQVDRGCGESIDPPCWPIDLELSQSGPDVVGCGRVTNDGGAGIYAAIRVEGTVSASTVVARFWYVLTYNEGLTDTYGFDFEGAAQGDVLSGRSSAWHHLSTAADTSWFWTDEPVSFQRTRAPVDGTCDG